MAAMATVQDAIEMLRDPDNLKVVGDGTTEVYSVKAERVVGLLHLRGAETRQEAVGLIRQATRALGGDEVIVNRASALHVDQFTSERSRATPAFWIPME
jgi:hypothetical protein